WTNPVRPGAAFARGGSFLDACEIAGLACFDQFKGEPGSPLPNAGFRVQRRASPSDPPEITLRGHTLVKVPGGVFGTGIRKEHAAQVSKTAREFGYTPEAFMEAFPEAEHLLPDFYLSKFPATNEEYREFTRETGHSTPEHWLTGRAPF